MSIEIQDRFGGRTIVNNPAMIDTILEVNRNFDAKCDAFHDELMSLGVKAYRCNDGWVDRINHYITFFADERYKGYYWGNMHLENGDKIFIGNASDGGKFAIIDRIVRLDYSSTTYHYTIIEEDKPEEKIGWFKRIMQMLRLWKS